MADRFEVYLGVLELANGYGELTDHDQQQRRFERDAAQRERMGQPTAGSQSRLLNALAAGLPDCSGAAMGIDRLLMALLGLTDIEEVIAYR